MKNTRNYIWGAAVLLMYSFLIISRFTASPPPQRTIRPPGPAQSQTQWVMALNVVKNQKTTAYTESPGAPPSSSGQYYTPGLVAVHPQVPANQGGSPINPIIPFGTTIYLVDPPYITIQGEKFNSLKVLDTGDINWSLWGESPYWIDVYYGSTSSWSYRQAASYGVGKVDYYWFHVIDDNGSVSDEDNQ